MKEDEPQKPSLLERIEHLETAAEEQREETAELRAQLEEQAARRPSDEEILVRHKTRQDVGRLTQFVFDAAAEDHELELDQDKVRRRASLRWANAAAVVRAEIERRGQGPEDLEAEMGWPKGWAERFFAKPQEFPYKQLRRVSERLGIPMTRLFEIRGPVAELGNGE